MKTAFSTLMVCLFTTKTVTFRDFVNIYAFALWQAGHPDVQPTRTGGPQKPAKAVVKKDWWPPAYADYFPVKPV